MLQFRFRIYLRIAYFVTMIHMEDILTLTCSTKCYKWDKRCVFKNIKSDLVSLEYCYSTVKTQSNELSFKYCFRWNFFSFNLFWSVTNMKYFHAISSCIRHVTNLFIDVYSFIVINAFQLPHEMCST